jgi:predicted Zn-dependent protease with MMP-like domain
MPTVEEFSLAVASAVEALPEDMRRDLQGVPVRAEELPADEDLLSGEPPLSPAILGLFRGPPLGEPCEGLEVPCRSVALYRRNLARVVRTREELLEQIRVTLLHEVGHLRGEDDEELAARGLE